MKIPIYHHKYNCYKCGKDIEIFYPEDLALKHNLGNVQKVFSHTMKRDTIGNVCKYCGYYQGNNYISSFVFHNIYDNFLKSIIWVNSQEKCIDCNALIEYDISNDESDIWDFFEGYYGKKCYSCINYDKIEDLIQNIHNSPICEVCKKIILKDECEDYTGYIIDNQNIVLSKANIHHTDYGNNKTITVCSICHMKIHQSDDPEYTVYKPVDKRPMNKKYKMVPCRGCSVSKARVPISEYDKNKNYFCIKCKNNLDIRANIWWEEL